jgi:hypothetical protein
MDDCHFSYMTKLKKKPLSKMKFFENHDIFQNEKLIKKKNPQKLMV